MTKIERAQQQARELLATLADLPTDDARHEVMRVLYDRVCKHCGAYGEGHCYCTADD